MEKWIVFNNYLISNYGKIKNISTDRLLKFEKSYNGYYRVTLYVDGKPHRYLVHRLIWFVFNGDIPEGYQINHINEDKSDNRLENLCLMTPKENINWGTCLQRRSETRTGVLNTKRSKSVCQYTLDGELVKVWLSAAEVERQLGYTAPNISACCNNKLKKYKNYVWKFNI